MRTLFYVLAGIVVVALIFGYFTAYRGSDTVCAVVTDKQVKRSGDDDKYLIFTDKETFENVDSILESKFNSADFYGSIQLGQCYCLTVYGVSYSYSELVP